MVLAVGWSTWQQEAASPPPPPNPAEAQPPPAPEVMDLADTSVRSSLRELDEQERLQALQEADRRLRDQKRQRALQQAVGDHMRDPAGTLPPSQLLPEGEYQELDVVAEEIRQQEARRRYESLRAPQIVQAAEQREPVPGPVGEAPAVAADPVAESSSPTERLYEGLARGAGRSERYGALLEGGTAVPTAEASAPPHEAAAPGDAAPPMLRAPRDPEGWERLYEGEFLECVLVTQLRGDFPGPANAMVAVDMWSRDRQRVAIPRGSRVLGTASAVSQWGQARLGVAFHRLIFPDGRYVSLDQFTGLNQVGETGLKDKVNNHYKSVFGAAAAVGLLSGLTVQNTTVYGRGRAHPGRGRGKPRPAGHGDHPAVPEPAADGDDPRGPPGPRVFHIGHPRAARHGSEVAKGGNHASSWDKAGTGRGGVRGAAAGVGAARQGVHRVAPADRPDGYAGLEYGEPDPGGGKAL